jgi:adenine deaminase
MDSVGDLIELIEAASGERKLDLVIRDVQIVNVFTGEIAPGVLGVYKGRIVYPHLNTDISADQILDGKGYYALPGLIDTHVHVDSTLLTPSALAELIVPHGTTAVFADPMEIANVAGIEGLKALVEAADDLPFHFFVEVPSRVPSAPGLETTGGTLGLEETRRLLSWGMTVSLGELDPSKVLGRMPEYIEKVLEAQSNGKISNGHTAGLSQEDLAVYACARIADDHECVSYKEAKARLAVGMAILVREGSTERNLEALVGGLVQENADTRHWMMCTDDKHPDDIAREGHIDYMVRKAISIGLEPVKAIQMATINAALHFRQELNIGSLAPGRWADLILSRDLHNVQPEMVFFRGELVAENGQLTCKKRAYTFPDWLRQTVKVTRGREPGDFILKADGERVEAWLIKISADQIVNERKSVLLDVVDGNALADIGRDALKLAVVERYGMNGNIGITFVSGFGLKSGALASSVSHDHHNIVIVGTDEASMACCVRAIQRMQGGLVACQGEEVLAELPLPVAGLLSEHNSAQVITALQKMNQTAHDLGCPLPAPFMSLSFISLPTVPELGLTDMGLVDVTKHEIISPFVSKK